MAEITITTDDYEVTADNPYDAAKTILELECEQARGQAETEGELPSEQPAATLGDEEITPQDLVEVWGRKWANPTLDQNARAAYWDAAEKLAIVLNEWTLTEAP